MVTTKKISIECTQKGNEKGTYVSLHKINQRQREMRDKKAIRHIENK